MKISLDTADKIDQVEESIELMQRVERVRAELAALQNRVVQHQEILVGCATRLGRALTRVAGVTISAPADTLIELGESGRPAFVYTDGEAVARRAEVKAATRTEQELPS